MTVIKCVMGRFMAYISVMANMAKIAHPYCVAFGVGVKGELF